MSNLTVGITPKNHGLLSLDNTKTRKGESEKVLTLILHLIPSDQNSYGVDLCPYASEDCRKLCLNKSGLAQVFPSIEKARLRKADEFIENRKGFTSQLIEEIAWYLRKAGKAGWQLAIRLNGTSDIQWVKQKSNHGNMTIFEVFPRFVQFYDYTKDPAILRASAGITNYDVTFSWSGENLKECKAALAQGFNVAVPFHGEIPETYRFKWDRSDRIVLNGDETDLRYQDKKGGYVIGLKVKGNVQKKDKGNGFFINISKKGE